MVKGAFWKVGLGAVLLLLVSAAPGWCDSVSIALTSSSGGVYVYGLVPPSPSFVAYGGDLISFTGLSGVTGASTSVYPPPTPFILVSYTATSAVFEIDPSISTISFAPYIVAPTNDWAINSSVLTLGTIDWTISGPGITTPISGTVLGPVAATLTPEPSSAALMLLGIGLVLVMRKRIAQGLPQAN
jgi:hypothetical protein